MPSLVYRQVGQAETPQQIRLEERPLLEDNPTVKAAVTAEGKQRE